MSSGPDVNLSVLLDLPEVDTDHVVNAGKEPDKARAPSAACLNFPQPRVTSLQSRRIRMKEKLAYYHKIKFMLRFKLIKANTEQNQFNK